MGVVSPSQSSPGEEITAAKINNPINQLAAVVNGNIDANNLADSGVTTSKLATGGVTEPKLTHRPSEYLFDHVASGCVWSGDAYASTLNASMTAGVVYVAGLRVAVSSVSARAFTASKDTYIDVDSTGALTYTEVTNNAASPALAASSIRLAIIVSGASNIAAATSVNQGQETRVLPIASSIPYTVTDSLGNLICPRDPQRKILGLRRRSSNFTNTSATPAVITELTVPVIVPTGRKVKLTIGGESMYNTSAGQYAELDIWETAVGGGGTQISRNTTYNTTATGSMTAICTGVRTPATSSITYLGALSNPSAVGTATLLAVSVAPAYLLVELV